jgi:hypothetical protein
MPAVGWNDTFTGLGSIVDDGQSSIKIIVTIGVDRIHRIILAV